MQTTMRMRSRTEHVLVDGDTRIQ